MQFRSYDFPNATVRVYRDRTCRMFPKWCLAISTEWTRAETAKALRMLRDFRRMQASKPAEAATPPAQAQKSRRDPRDARARHKSRLWARAAR